MYICRFFGPRLELPACPPGEPEMVESCLPRSRFTIVSLFARSWLVPTLAFYNSFHSSIVPTLAQYYSFHSSIVPTFVKTRVNLGPCPLWRPRSQNGIVSTLR